MSLISIHAPTRGATANGCRRLSDCRAFQSTLPRGERLIGLHAIYATPVISIHAPTRGATTSSHLRPVPTQISIHAPTRGATNILLPSEYIFVISIHAPTRGATQSVLDIIESDAPFQSTLPRGERPDYPVKCIILSKFQSTLPRGERRSPE